MRLFRRRKMSTSYSDIPIGVRLIQANLGASHSELTIPYCRYKFSVLSLTYLAYMCYHLTRKPISVVKSVLHRNCSDLLIPKEFKVTPTNESTWCDYPPFDGPDSAALLGTLDSAFLFSYGAAMFVSGFVAERVSIRYFLTFGMLLSGIFTYLFGIAKTYDIHSMWYFIFVQAMAGICQTTGWPGVVTVLGRWFGKSKRGLIFGIWNSHTSIGNILGSLIAAEYVETDWSMSFIVPGFIMGIVGFGIFLFLVDSPEIVGCQESTTPHVQRRNVYNRVECGSVSDDCGSDVDDTDIIVGEQTNPSIRSLRGSVNSEVNHRPTERTPILSQRHTPSGNASDAIGFLGALRIPGVVEYSLCLFFSKLVSYTFLYWLPLYIQYSTSLGATHSADLSIMFDVGGIIGAIAAGVLSDYTGMSACTCAGMLIFAIPLLLVYQSVGTVSLGINIFLLFIVGIVVNGPYSLITTSVSTELGTHSSLEGNSKALATVTAIIDGTGSIGAAVGPLIAGIVSSSGWENVFHMLVISDVVALILLLRLVRKEVIRQKRSPRID
ncbi:Glucose-6-phosphate exchanger SLC37A2 [Pseudolycoriella hygida]|uniref:Sugar phosphate exchanger 3 n=1 Tax=Pseudolycoriella hygida TaxID=35572 RepID=A0A9Q0S5L9_9DIPT|nr:Glucose-6-phosphate exchanger SLC37A2 [Pseudolycoriella hygida]